jgi:adenylate cyclase
MASPAGGDATATDVLADAPEWARRAWRAAGYNGDDELTTTDTDLLGAARRFESDGVLAPDDVVRLAQLLHLATTPIAEHVWATIQRASEAGTPLSDEVTGEGAAAVETALVHAFRRHLARLEAGASHVPADRVEAVAFVDLVGFTALTEGSDDWLLAVRRLEDIAFETVPAHGARVLKLIGDEVMFVADRPEAVLRALSELRARWEEEGDGPPLRAGAAFGSVVWLPGDRLGPAVNLASRLAAAARPGQTLLCPAITEHAPAAGVAVKRTRRRRLRGIGWVHASALAPMVSIDQRNRRGGSTTIPPSRMNASTSQSPAANHQTAAMAAVPRMARVAPRSRMRSATPSTMPGPARPPIPIIPAAQYTPRAS